MKRLYTILALLGLITLTGCASIHKAPFSLPGGALFTNIKAPLTTKFHNTKVSEKRGTATSSYFRDFLLTGLSFAWNDCDINTAAANGNLTKVHYADYSTMQILGFYSKTTVTVYGE